MASGEKKKVVVVEDHPLARRGIVQLINEDTGLSVIGEAEDVGTAIKLIREKNPDAVVADISLKDSSGIDLIKEMTTSLPDVPVLVFSMHDESFYAERVLRAGARGFVTKGEPATKVVEGIHRIIAGDIFVSEKVSSMMLRRVASGSRTVEAFPIDRLSDREFEVFGMIGEGVQTRDIAEKLHLSTKTVESHRENIKRKLKIDNATELLQRAMHWVRFERGT